MGCHSNENNLFYTQKARKIERSQSQLNSLEALFEANGIMGIGPSALDREAILDKIFKEISSLPSELRVGPSPRVPQDLLHLPG